MSEQEVQVKRKPGRPKEFFYTEELSEKLFEIFEKGGDIAEFCLYAGIKSKKTFHNLLAENEDMRDDYEVARMARETYLREMCMKVLRDPSNPKYKNFNTKLFMWQAANMAPESFSHNMNPGGQTVNIGSINTVNQSPKLEHQTILAELEKLAKDPELLAELDNAQNKGTVDVRED